MSALAAAFLCLTPVAVDGDTLRCQRQGLVRLIGIDAPELPGHCRAGRVCTAGDGWASQAALARAIGGATVRCRAEGFDVYGRILARCATPAGVDLACAQLAAGAAVVRYADPRCR